MTGRLIVVVGGQFGSEGKGAVAGWLSAREQNLVAVRTGGPNAGHTVVAGDKTWKLRCIPAAAVTNPQAYLALAPDSEIDPEVLEQEILELEKGGIEVRSRLMVDRGATIIGPDAAELEQSLVRKIGSTGKGVGAARSSRIMRQAELWGGETWVPSKLRQHLLQGGTVLLEGSQGFGLGLHAGFYPFCTSRDCTAMDVIAGAGLAPWAPEVRELAIWVVMRTYPIRVAGTSGPLRNETTWEDVGLPEERTTVTNKVRRIGTWDPNIAKAAIWANGGEAVRVALTMVDHVEPELAGHTNRSIRGVQRLENKVSRVLWKYEHDLGGAKIWSMGTGPNTMIVPGPFRAML